MKKLNFEFVPDGCWNSNLRNILSKKAWEFIRKDAISRSNNICSICKAKSRTLHAHEMWEYDIKTATQKLKDVVAVCPDCHSAIHINRTYLKGNGERAEDHYMKVNGCNYSTMRQDMGRANDLQKQLNEVSEWKLDVSWLKKFIDEK